MSAGPTEAARIADVLEADFTCLWTADAHGAATPLGTWPAWPMPDAFRVPQGDAGSTALSRGAAAHRALPMCLRERFAPVGEALAVLRACGDARSGILVVWTTPVRPDDVQALGLFAAERWAYAAKHLQVAEELAEVEAQRHALIFGLPQGVVLVPRGAGPGLVNPAAARLLSLPAGPVSGRVLAGALHALLARSSTADQMRPLFARVLSGGRDAIQGCVLRFDADASAIEVTVAPLPSGAMGWVWLMDDVTARETAVQRIAHAAEIARSATDAKTRFISNVSHEIRTPLNAMIGMTHLLHGTDLDVTQQDYLATIDAAGRHLLGLVNDVLDVSKIEAGAMTFVRDVVSLRRVVDDVVTLCTPLAARKGLALETRIEAHVLQTAMTDEGRLRQMLVNLVNNAIKFTATGGVSLHVSRTSAGPPDRVRFAVSDTGIGIPADQCASLFLPFSQGSPTIAQTYGGTGLGLFLVRQFAERLGGTVGVQSTPGQGSTFWFELPLDPSPSRSAPLHDQDTSVPSLAGCRILVVDDNAVNRRVCQLILQRLGAVVDTEDDGAAAVARLRRAPAVDLVLMDIQMPGMDGLTATRAIRDVLELTGLPILAFTGAALGAERDQALAAGMNGFLVKPIDPPVLARTIAAHVFPAVLA